ncbi:MAG: hypothetical protein HC825_01445 [Oscillatoriales cyanobacterium RM1_1_9]|nr:hypothetical protein [Oscillatoriales cyanobacterium RM1_1_9]
MPRFWAGSLAEDAAFERGLTYLYDLRQQLPQSDLIELMLLPEARRSACSWIGQHIDQLNLRLDALLQRCHQAVPQPAQLSLYAAPLAARFQLDGICCWPMAEPETKTKTEALVLLDLGVLAPQHWLRLLVHEYAHALCAQPGHGLKFQAALSMLCSALQIELPASESWYALPAYPRTADRTAFWQGQPSSSR